MVATANWTGFTLHRSTETSYDVQDRKIKAVVADSTGVIVSGTAFSYDAVGRIERLTQGANSTRFEHLGPRLIIERGASGAMLRRYIHGPGVLRLRSG